VTAITASSIMHAYTPRIFSSRMEPVMTDLLLKSAVFAVALLTVTAVQAQDFQPFPSVPQVRSRIIDLQRGSVPPLAIDTALRPGSRTDGRARKSADEGK
jgi:hypothetical protein